LDEAGYLCNIPVKEMSSYTSYHERNYPAFFKGKKLQIVSRHEKHRYIAPPLVAATGMIVESFTEIDTDLLGTFSGEVERTMAPLDCAREKCRQAAAYFSEGYLLASEGSFGPHPAFGLLSAGEEWLLFYDIAEKKEIIVRDVTLDICFRGERLTEETVCLSFLEQVGFPRQKVIVKSSQQQPAVIIKNLDQTAEVIQAMQDLIAQYGDCFIETDMRAMNNPARQIHLLQLGTRLAEKLCSICEQCGWYGFSVTRVERGLPCSWCGSQTDGVLYEVCSCAQCGFEKEKYFPKGKQQEDPQFCNQCNP
jgi:hypothetical protein